MKKNKQDSFNNILNNVSREASNYEAKDIENIPNNKIIVKNDYANSKMKGANTYATSVV